MPAEAKMKRAPFRRLERGHFAFMRALLQGLDERASWERYLHNEGEATDRRTVRQTIAWIKDEFAAAAKREARPGTARLVRLDPDKFPAAADHPTLEAFALEHGLEEFSEAEQAAAYADAFPKSIAGYGPRQLSNRPAKRARVISRQLEALNWLERHTARDPLTSDCVTEWLNPAVAGRLDQYGLTTLSSLVAHINLKGARWWTAIPGIGPLKAARVVQWIHAHESVSGLRVGAHALVPRTRASNALLDQVIPPATALVPWEKFQVPQAVDGSQGQYRAADGRCLLNASNDKEAMAAWLAAKTGHRRDGAMPATTRAYRKEVERLLLWSVLEQRKAVSSLTAEDVVAYRDFLNAPPPHWCGPRHTQRWSPEWRPLEGPLSISAQRYALTVLRGMFRFLVAQQYLSDSPFEATQLLLHNCKSAGRTGFEQNARGPYPIAPILARRL